jgi:hypothetical protein
MEYTFFNQELRERFIRMAAGMGVASSVREDTMEGSVVGLPDDLSDEQMATLEAEYELLMDEQMVLAESEEGWVTHQAMGVNVTLAGGRPCTIRLQGEMARRLSGCFSPQEIHELVHEIAQSIANPIDGPLCKRA